MIFRLIFIYMLLTAHSYASLSDECHSINYYDQNADGIIDHETHNYSCVSHSDWELIDLDYDGRYDLKKEEGGSKRSTKVDLRAPKIQH